VNPARTGTKAAADYQLMVGPGETRVIKLRLGDAAPGKSGTGLGKDFDEIFAARLHEADEFYASVAPATIGEDRARILRQALAGMLWTKQFYSFEADTWLEEHHSHPLLGQTGRTRNQDWYHMVNDDVISMPDKWEYPWYAAWDLAFHCIALSAVDTEYPVLAGRSEAIRG
jgi:hypothetical protein